MIRIDYINRIFANTPCAEQPEKQLYAKSRKSLMANHYRVSIPNYNLVNDKVNNTQYVEYCIFIEHKISKSVRSLRFRYKELKNIHDSITKDIEKFNLSITLPEFPSKRIFGRTNTNKDSILQRKYELEFYLNDLISYTQVQSHPLISSMLPSAVDQLTKPNNIVKPNYVQKDDLYSLVESDCLDINSKDSTPLNNKSQLLVKIKSFDRTEQTVLYNIDFHHQTSHIKWQIQSRYNDLKNLHLGVKACSTDKNIKLPEFPGKRIFTSTNDNLDEVFIRQAKLEKYLNELLEIENIYPQNQALKNFIDSSKRQAFAEQLCKQVNQEVVPQHYANNDIQSSTEKNSQNKSNENNNNKKQPRFKFSQKVDVQAFYFFNSTQDMRQKQQKRLLKRKIKKILQSLPLSYIIEDEEQTQNEDTQ